VTGVGYTIPVTFFSGGDAMSSTLAWTFQPDERAPAQLRHDLTAHYTEICPRMDDDAVDTAVLLLSELVTNAVRHGCGEIGVRVSNRDGRLRVAISDSQDALPRLVPLNLESDHGRGMQLVEALSEAWGVDPASPPDVGKSVWFEVA
jgi:hypothetical protein